MGDFEQITLPIATTKLFPFLKTRFLASLLSIIQIFCRGSCTLSFEARWDTDSIPTGTSPAKTCLVERMGILIRDKCATTALKRLCTCHQFG